MIVEFYPEEVREVLDCPEAPLVTRMLLHVLTHSDAEGICASGYADLREDLRMVTPDDTVGPPSRRRIDKLVRLGVADGLYGARSRVGSIGLMVGRRVDAEDREDEAKAA